MKRVDPTDAGAYSVFVTGLCGSVETAPGVLTVDEPVSATDPSDATGERAGELFVVHPSAVSCRIDLQNAESDHLPVGVAVPGWGTTGATKDCLDAK